MNADTLRNLLIPLDYDTMIKLGRDSQWRVEITQLLSDDSLWKSKTEWLADKPLPNLTNANWVRIYDRVSSLMNQLSDVNRSIGVLDRIYRPSLDDVNVLRIFLEILPAVRLKGDVIERRKLTKLGRNIQSLDVLRWLLDNYYIESTQDNIRTLFYGTMRSDNLETASYLYDKIDSPSHDLVVRAVQSGAIEIFKFLDERLQEARKYDVAIILARSGSPAMLRAVLDRHARYWTANYVLRVIQVLIRVNRPREYQDAMIGVIFEYIPVMIEPNEVVQTILRHYPEYEELVLR